MWRAEFWKQAAERAVKTFGQVILAAYVAGQFDVLKIDWSAWQDVVITAAIAAGVSVLVSIGSLPVGPGGTPSWIRVWDAAQLALAERARGLVLTVDKAATPTAVDRSTDRVVDALAEVGQLKP